SAESTVKLTHASLSKPATTRVRRSVATIAALAVSSSHRFMGRRSIGVTSFRTARSGGISGPLYTLDAEVLTTTGTEKATAVLASANAALRMDWRSADPAAKARPAWRSTRTTAQSEGVSREGIGALLSEWMWLC